MMATHQPALYSCSLSVLGTRSYDTIEERRMLLLIPAQECISLQYHPCPKSPKRPTLLLQAFMPIISPRHFHNGIYVKLIVEDWNRRHRENL